MIAVDTSVMVDIIGDSPGASASVVALREALAAGPVVACEVVLAELVAAYGARAAGQAITIEAVGADAEQALELLCGMLLDFKRQEEDGRM